VKYFLSVFVDSQTMWVMGPDKMESIINILVSTIDQLPKSTLESFVSI
jgi:hypothetical protein